MPPAKPGFPRRLSSIATASLPGSATRSDLDQPLADIVAGKWDVKAEAQRQKEERVRAAQVPCRWPRNSRKPATTIPRPCWPILDAAIKDDAKMETMLAAPSSSAREPQGSRESHRLWPQLMATLQRQRRSLNELAWDLADPDRDKKADPKLVKIASMPPRRACELTKNKDPNLLDTLAVRIFSTATWPRRSKSRKRQ